MGSDVMNLLISDLLTMPKEMSPSGLVFKYGKHSVSAVEIFGTVLSVRDYEDKKLYEIDDGTGVILCTRFCPRSCPTSGNVLSAEEEMLQTRLLKTVNEKSIKQGDFVVARGKLKEWQGKRNICLFFIKLEEDHNWESFLIFRQIDLYNRLYDS